MKIRGVVNRAGGGQVSIIVDRSTEEYPPDGCVVYLDDAYTVRCEPEFEPTYVEDDVIEVRKGDLRAVLDVATGSMDFGSGFLDNEQVEALRKMATLLGIDPNLCTPSNFVCQYKGHCTVTENRRYCVFCHKEVKA